MDALPLIHRLDAGFVPHRQWPLRKWYFANPLWFYHQPYAVDEMIPSRKFYELVDPELRELCRTLHAAGLHTTPSCQGHFYGRGRFQAIWDELQREQARIRGPGLVVEDSETQEEYLFQDNGFALPWESFEQFHEQAGAQQGIGYIGVLIPPEAEDVLEAMSRLTWRGRRCEIAFDDEIGGRLGSRLLAFTVTPSTPQERGDEWERITRAVQEALGRTAASAA